MRPIPLRVGWVLASLYLVAAACATLPAEACPTDDFAVAHFLDVSSSGRDERLLEERLDVIERSVGEVADCDGRMVLNSPA